MSLIVARKKGKQLALVSDTKLTFPNHEIKGIKSNPSDGMIKVVIVNSNLCISFAGEIDYANDALNAIDADFSFSEAIEVLEKYHEISDFKTEFLVCTGNPEPTIHKIKYGESKAVQSSWIGDLDAFNRFQESFMGTRKKTPQIKKGKVSNTQANVTTTEMNLSAETNMQVNLFSKMSSAMDEVIEDDNISSVGGFKVNVVYQEQFDYTKYVKLYRGNVEFYGSGTHVIGHGSAGEGAYSVNFFGGSNDFKSVGLHIKQGNFGIVYHRNMELLRPQIIKLDEVDFSDYVKEKFNLSAALLTQDRIQKFIIDGKLAFNKREFHKAKDTFDKALVEATGKRKAEPMFYKGICLLNLRDIPTAMQVFQQAINIDNAYQYKLMQVLSQRQ